MSQLALTCFAGGDLVGNLHLRQVFGASRRPQSRAEIFDKRSYPKQQENNEKEPENPARHHHAGRHCRHIHHHREPPPWS
jgi:hypothetical protein